MAAFKRLLSQDSTDDSVAFVVDDNDDDSFIYVDSPTKGFLIERIGEKEEPCSRTGIPVSRAMLQQFYDSDLRLTKEQEFRKSVFSGGIEHDVRAECWQFLFRLYPCDTTKREREAALADFHARYCALRDRWKNIVRQKEPESNLEGASTLGAEPYNSFSRVENPQDIRAQLPFQCVHAKIAVERETMTEYNDGLRKAIKLIDKDVPRTDRDVDYYKSDSAQSLIVLRDILITYAAYKPESTYAQGMNDIAAKFLYVFDNEVEAYWCFAHYMQEIELEFTAEGIVKKQDHVHQLLREIHPDLLLHFENIGVGELSMCHRWLLLGFKREFHYPEVLRCFEILSSQHLELSSSAAENERRLTRRKEFEQIQGATRQQSSTPSADYSFDLFMAIGLLLRNEPQYRAASDVAEVFSFTNSLAYNLSLDNTLEDAERVFFYYCRKSAIDCFQVVDD